MSTGHDYWQELSSLSALGVLDEAEAAAWAGHLKDCAECHSEAAAWNELVGTLAYSAPVAAPAPALRDRLLGSLDPLNGKGRKVIRAEQANSDWQSAGAPGVDFRLLQRDTATGDQTLVVRLAPGAKYAPHRHAGSEHCYVLQGDLVFEDHTLNAGDYSVSAPGSTHTSATSINGCLLLIVNNVGDELLVAH